MGYFDKRIIFAGGTDWSVDFLKALIDEGFNVVGVMAPPDAKKDRGQKIAVHLLKTEADKLSIPVLQPMKLNDPDFLQEFKKIMPDIVVVVAYGKLFPKEILDIPSLGFINFHPSLLPKLRGPSPIASAILEGYTETGVSIMKLGEGMDDGPILTQESMEIDQRETSETLTRKSVDLGIKILPVTLKKYIEGIIVPEPQPKEGVTICKMIRKEDGRIDWQNETAEQIDRKIRALNPQFKTYTNISKNNQKKRVNILESNGVGFNELLPEQYELVGKNLAIGAKKSVLLINKLQIEGKNPVTAEEFYQGYKGGKFIF